MLLKRWVSLITTILYTVYIYGWIAYDQVVIIKKNICMMIGLAVYLE